MTLSPFTPTINKQLSATRRDYSFSARNNCNSVTVPMQQLKQCHGPVRPGEYVGYLRWQTQ